jgi:hypothetical protein
VSEQDPRLREIIDRLKRPVVFDSGFDEKVMERVKSVRPPRSWTRGLWAAAYWMVRERTLTVRPLHGLALATSIVALLLIVRVWPAKDAAVATQQTASADSTALVQFVIVAPTAGSVSLVGDFNDWTAADTPMQRVEGNGVWSVSVPLTVGRYRYAFLVDGTTWLRDPSAPPALDDEFGRPGSVLTIGEL